jgi:hypothetical protein
MNSVPLLDPSVFDHTKPGVEQIPEKNTETVQSDFAALGTPLQEASCNEGTSPIAAGATVSVRKILARGEPVTGNQQRKFDKYPGLVIGKNMPGVLKGSVIADIRVVYLVVTEQGSQFVVEPFPE